MTRTEKTKKPKVFDKCRVLTTLPSIYFAISTRSRFYKRFRFFVMSKTHTNGHMEIKLKTNIEKVPI